MPFGARSVGHYVLPSTEVEAPAVKHFVQIFWGIKGTGLFSFDGVETPLPPDHIAIYLPGMEHRLKPLGDWEYRWWTMDGPLAEALTVGMGLTAGVVKAGPAPLELFERLETTIVDLSAQAVRRAAALAFELLTHTHSCMAAKHDDALAEAMLQAIQENWNDPDLSVAHLATDMGIHRSTLTRRFHTAVGLSPVEYIAGIRIQNAMSMLKQTAQTVSEIAHSCGCDDPSYFARLFRKRIGMSPLEFRNHGS
jgi:AraC-like DNA-binding protein